MSTNSVLTPCKQRAVLSRYSQTIEPAAEGSVETLNRNLIRFQTGGLPTSPTFPTR